MASPRGLLNAPYGTPGFHFQALPMPWEIQFVNPVETDEEREADWNKLAQLALDGSEDLFDECMTANVTNISWKLAHLAQWEHITIAQQENLKRLNELAGQLPPWHPLMRRIYETWTKGPSGLTTMVRYARDHEANGAVYSVSVSGPLAPETKTMYFSDFEQSLQFAKAAREGGLERAVRAYPPL
jgi:hypothetical protein